MVTGSKANRDEGSQPGDGSGTWAASAAMANHRQGEKLGWIGGWLGGFIWVAILAIILLVKHQVLEGICGLALVGAAVLVILACAPWRHPHTSYWRLMLPIYALLLAALGWAVWTWTPGDLGLTRWNAFWVLPLLIPFVTAGRRRWSDPAGMATEQSSRPS